MKGVVALLAMVSGGVMAAPVGAQEPLHMESLGPFTAPIHVTAPRHDLRRVFVVERAGRIRVVRDGVTLPTPFLDIGSRVTTGGERGLLSMAFPPDYAQTRRFYVFYNRVENPATPDVELGDVMIDEYLVRKDDPDQANPATRRNVMTIEHSARENHNGGQLQFGPDGLLFASLGEGDFRPNGQDRGTVLGKMIRIDPRATGASAYSVPPDNPYVGQAGIRPEIWSYGLRNPWRFSFDRLTGDIAIGDVGQNRYEEINWVPWADGGGAGANFGWTITEGNVIFQSGVPVTEDNEPPDYVGPTIVRLHSEGDTSITGGFVVRDPALEPLTGRYVYSDFFRGILRSALLTPGGVLEDEVVPGLPAFQNLSSFGEDACGRIYMTSLRGEVRRLATSGQCVVPPEACTITGTGGPDVLGGKPGRDVICGLGGNDVIKAGAGDDVVSGGPGDDRLVGGSGADVLQGNEGVDTADYRDRTAALGVSIGDGPGDGEAGEGDDVEWDVEAVLGGRGADVLTGNESANPLNGGAGGDELRGGAGHDTLTGGDGGDALAGEAGEDTMDGGPGADAFSGGPQSDRVTYLSRTGDLALSIGGLPDGAPGEGDEIGSDVERVTGGSGDDVLAGADGADILIGSGGDDTLHGGGGDDVLDGREGEDELIGGAQPDGADRLLGGTGFDLADYSERGTAVSVTLDSVPDDGAPGEGDDVRTHVEAVNGGDGGDTLVGSAGADTLEGLEGDDVVEGGAGEDVLGGGPGADDLRAQDGEIDQVACGSGLDIVSFDLVDVVDADCETS